MTLPSFAPGPPTCGGGVEPMKTPIPLEIAYDAVASTPIRFPWSVRCV